jgi:predicted Zn-dependent protease
MRVRVVCAVLFLGFSTACATGGIEPAGGLRVDEQHVLTQANDHQIQLDRSGAVYADPELTRYVNGIAEMLVGPELAAVGMKPRIRVLSHVEMNAFALPNGAVYLHTGVLARLNNEAQLAALIGHEYSHVLYRHALRRHRDTKSKRALAATLAVGASATPSEHGRYAGLAMVLVQVATISSIYGYSRDAEREADREGIERMARAGYDLEGAPGCFQAMLGYQEELEAQGIDRDLPPYFLSTHPRLEERIEDTRALIARRGDARAGRTGDSVYAARVEPVRVHQASLEIDAGRPRSAERTIRLVLDRNPDHALAWVTLGQALEEADDGNEQAARRAFQRALEIDPGLGPAHRSLGMLHYRDWREGGASDADAATALAHFQRYLALEAEAPDRAYVARYVQELRLAVPPAVAAGAAAP